METTTNLIPINNQVVGVGWMGMGWMVVLRANLVGNLWKKNLNFFIFYQKQVILIWRSTSLQDPGKSLTPQKPGKLWCSQTPGQPLFFLFSGSGNICCRFRAKYPGKWVWSITTSQNPGKCGWASAQDSGKRTKLRLWNFNLKQFTGR